MRGDYPFDAGDKLRHTIEVIDIVPAPAEGRYPRIGESHGAPPQYAGWDEE